VCVCTKEFSLDSNSNTLAPDWPQHHRSAACVVVQKYFSATFGSLHFLFRNLKVGAPFKKMLLFHVVTFVRHPSLKLRNLKLRKSGRVST
jgi:hypothetical protein